MTTAISFANGKNGFCQVNSYCRSIHLDFPFLRFRLIDRNSILAHRCRLAYATSGMWEVLFIVVPLDFDFVKRNSTKRPLEQLEFLGRLCPHPAGVERSRVAASEHSISERWGSAERL